MLRGKLPGCFSIKQTFPHLSDNPSIIFFHSVLNCYHINSGSLPTSANVSTHEFQTANSPLRDENSHMKIDSLNRCHGNVIVSAAITALCLTNSHKSSSLYKEDVVALHSHSIIRYCCTHGVTSRR